MGAWETYDELEESLTIQELMETYVGMMEQHNRFVKSMARLMGAEVKEDSKSDFDRVLERARSEEEDIVSRPIKTKSGDQFGIGFGLGYEEA